MTATETSDSRGRGRRTRHTLKIKRLQERKASFEDEIFVLLFYDLKYRWVLSVLVSFWIWAWKVAAARRVIASDSRFRCRVAMAEVFCANVRNISMLFNVLLDSLSCKLKLFYLVIPFLIVERDKM